MVKMMNKEELFDKLNLELDNLVYFYSETDMSIKEFCAYLIAYGSKSLVIGFGNELHVGKTINEAVKMGIEAGVLAIKAHNEEANE